MRYVSDERSKQQYTEFMARNGRPVQRAAAGQKSEIVLAEDARGNVTGALGVYIRRIPLFGNLMCSPGGPVCAPEDAGALRQLTEGAELLAWKYNAMALELGPDMPADSRLRARLANLGWRTGPRTAYMAYRPVKRRLYRLARRVLHALRARRDGIRSRRTAPVSGLLPSGGDDVRGTTSA